MWQLLVVFLTVGMVACAGFGPKKAESDWNVLESASKVDCAAWPKPEKVLSTSNVQVVQGRKVALISQVQLRNGAPARVYAEFQGDEEIDVKSLQPRRFGANSVLAGGGDVDKRLSVVIIQRSGGKPKLEVRSLKDNVVRYSADVDARDVKAASAQIYGKGIWLTIHVAGEDTSLEDAEQIVSHYEIATRNGKGILIKKTFEEKFPPTMQLVMLDDYSAIAFYGRKKSDDQKSFKFYLRHLDQKAQAAGAERELGVPVDSAVESWRVGPARRGFTLAYVDGDSLVGQANLRIARAYWEGDYERVVWQKTRSLLNEHVSEPYWLRRGDTQYLLLPKWMDAESTIGVYKLGETDIENATAVGVFPNSLRVLEAFHVEKEDDLFALVRYRKNNSRQFDLCNLGSLD